VICATVIILIVKAVSGGSIRVSKEEELKGLDLTEHGMDAYADFRLNQH
jgi:Amt family ammonium transporter